MNGKSPHPEALPVYREREHLDRATEALYQRLIKSQQTAAFIRQAETAPTCDLKDILLAIVPGAFYRDHAHTGADGQRLVELAESIGCRAEVLPLGSFDSMAVNSEAIIHWLRQRRGQRIVLASLSKASADVKQALRHPAAREAFQPVVAWINFSGLVTGTPLVDWLRRRRLRWLGVRLILWWRGHDIETLNEIRRGSDSPLAAWPEIPSHLRVVHVAGFPLREHLHHPWARRGYERLAPLGPNDGGGLLLNDLLDVPGAVYPIWGVDHYLQPSWDIRPTLSGILRAACQTTQSAAIAMNAPASKSTA